MSRTLRHTSTDAREEADRICCESSVISNEFVVIDPLEALIDRYSVSVLANLRLQLQQNAGQEFLLVVDGAM